LDDTIWERRGAAREWRVKFPKCFNIRLDGTETSSLTQNRISSGVLSITQPLLRALLSWALFGPAGPQS
jgi:hypothetical protein